MLKNAPKVEIPVRSLNDFFIWFDIKPDIVIAIRKAFRNQNYWVTFEKVKKIGSGGLTALNTFSLRPDI